MIKRLHSLDAMRAILMLIGVYFHLAHSYSLFPNPWSQNPETVSIVFDYFREIYRVFFLNMIFKNRHRNNLVDLVSGVAILGCLG